jgi:hypothetical protein
MAPNQYLFTEIIGRRDYLITPGDFDVFSIMLNCILADREQLFADKKWFYDRFEKCFQGMPLVKVLPILFMILAPQDCKHAK